MLYFKFLMILVCNVSLMIAQDSDNFIIDQKNMHFIEKAWQINTSGDQIPSYYSIRVNNHTFPGIRPFNVRWNMIKDVVDYTNKNVLELGCCTALPSTLLKKYKNVSRVVAVDMADYRLQAAQLFAQAFEVDVEFYKMHFGVDDYEDRLGHAFDVVFCMSLLHWIEDKERFLNYLSHFNHVIFEGHDSSSIEIERFKRHGFSHHEILGISDNGRTVIHFYQ